MRNNLPSNIAWTGASFAVALAIYVYVYYYEPLSAVYSPYVNDKVLDVLTLIPAVMAAALGSLIVREFAPSEPPFRIWLTFTLGWWAWVGGELLGFVYDALYPAGYPDLTFIDLCWMAGYFLFGLTLYYQFRLLYKAGQARRTLFYFGYIALGLLATWGLTEIALSAGLGKNASPYGVIYLSVLYPVFDIAEGCAALWLSFAFGRGTLGKAWWGLISFAVADSINIFFWLGGYKWMSDSAYYFWDAFSNAAYLLGYMITALAFLAAYNLLRYGVQRKAVSLPPQD